MTTVANHDHMRDVLTTDNPYVSRWHQYDPTGIYTGPRSVDIADVTDAVQADYEEGPLLDPRARMALGSATLAVLQHATEYDVVIGEDTSGRYPALVIGRAINIVRADAGLTPARRLFLSGRINNDTHTPRWQLAPDDAALVVTEYVVIGESTKAMHEAITAQSAVMPDYVVLGGNPERCAMRDLDEEVRPKSRVFVGDRTCFSDYADQYFCPGADKWKGVTKQVGHAHSSGVYADMNRIGVAASRREAALFATVLANHYLDSVRPTS